MRQAETYIPDDYLSGQTGTAERSASALITARRYAVRHGWRVNADRQAGHTDLGIRGPQALAKTFNFYVLPG